MRPALGYQPDPQPGTPRPPAGGSGIVRPCHHDELFDAHVAEAMERAAAYLSIEHGPHCRVSECGGCEIVAELTKLARALR